MLEILPRMSFFNHIDLEFICVAHNLFLKMPFWNQEHMGIKINKIKKECYESLVILIINKLL